jgi:hypothetical protein
MDGFDDFDTQVQSDEEYWRELDGEPFDLFPTDDPWDDYFSRSLDHNNAPYGT